jgi:hypothetical protein
MDELAYYRESDLNSTANKNAKQHNTNSMRSTKEPRRHHGENKQPNNTIGKSNNFSMDKSLPAETSPISLNELESNYNKYKYFSPEHDTHVSRTVTKLKHLPSLDSKSVHNNSQSQSSEYNSSNYSNQQQDTHNPSRKLSDNSAMSSAVNNHVKNNVTTINNRNKPLPTYSQLYQRGHSSFNLNHPTMNGNQFVKYDNNWAGGEVINNINNSNSSPSPAPLLTLNPKPVQYPQQSYLGSRNPPSQFFAATSGQALPSQQIYQPPPLLTTNNTQLPQQQEHFHANKRIPTSFHFAQSRSKSLDAHMFNESPELGKISLFFVVFISRGQAVLYKTQLEINSTLIFAFKCQDIF